MVTFDRHALRAAREAAHLTRVALGERAGVRVNLIERAEMGTHREPFGSSVAAIADALDVDMRTFYTPARVSA
jgi:transcriptional regulator with XRE-family HTH domain